MSNTSSFDFVAQSHMLAHDIKGAVGNMILFADLLREELAEQDEEAKSYVKHIDYTGKKLILLLETWIELTERLSGAFKPEKSNTNAFSIFEKVFKDVRFELHQRSIQLDIHGQGPLFIPLDSTTLEKLFTNLVLGLITFMDANASLNVTVSKTDGKALIIFKTADIYGAEEFFRLLNAPITHPTEISYEKGAIKPVVCGAHYAWMVMQESGGSIDISHQDSETVLTLILPAS